MQTSCDDDALSQPIIITTTENIRDAKVVRTVGRVFGLTVRSRSLGGEIKSYVTLSEDSRRQAIDRMVPNAASGRRDYRPE